MHHFNVYDMKWNWVDEFWSATDWGLEIGGIDKFKSGELYNATVLIKRMA